MREITRQRIVFAALVSIVVAPKVSAEELARLFFSAQERQALSQKRLAPPKAETKKLQSEIASDTVANEDVSESVVLPPPKITGRVVRSSGNNTVWMNQHPQFRRERQ